MPMDPFENKMIDEIRSISNDVCSKMAKDPNFGHKLSDSNWKNNYGPIESKEALDQLASIAMDSVGTEIEKNIEFTQKITDESDLSISSSFLRLL